MKKRISFAMALIFIVSMFSVMSVSAANPDVIHTGVKAYINNYPIESYTINNHTVVSTDDIKDYGFRVVWDQNSRAVYITADAFKSAWAPHAGVECFEAYNGLKVYDTVSSNIKVYVNGVKVDSYAVDKSTYAYGTLPNPTLADRTGVETYINLGDLTKASSFDWLIEKQWFADEKQSFLWYTNMPLNPRTAPMNAKTVIPFAHLTYTRAYEIAQWAVDTSIYSDVTFALPLDMRYNYDDNMYINADGSYNFALIFSGIVGPFITVNPNGTFSFNGIPAFITYDVLK